MSFESGSFEHAGYTIEWSVHKHDDGQWAGSYSLIRDGKVVGLGGSNVVVLKSTSAEAREATCELGREEAEISD